MQGSWGRFTYPSVLVCDDRILVAYMYQQIPQSRLKVLPISWFYGGGDPTRENPMLKQFLNAK